MCSSDLMALTADHLIVIGRGRLIANASVDEFVSRHSRNLVRVRSPQAAELADLVSSPEVSVTSPGGGVLEIEGLTSEQIGAEAAAHNVVLYELTPVQVTLEDAFIDLTQDELEFKTQRLADEASDNEGVAA